MEKKHKRAAWTPNADTKGGPNTHRVEEARAVYMATPPLEQQTAEYGTTRLSSKNQITLPVSMVRQLGLRAGDELDLLALGETIQLERRPGSPQEWIARYRGSLSVPEWSTEEAADAYVRGERDSWNREGDATS